MSSVAAGSPVPDVWLPDGTQSVDARASAIVALATADAPDVHTRAVPWLRDLDDAWNPKTGLLEEKGLPSLSVSATVAEAARSLGLRPDQWHGTRVVASAQAALRDPKISIFDAVAAARIVDLSDQPVRLDPAQDARLVTRTCASRSVPVDRMAAGITLAGLASSRSCHLHADQTARVRAGWRRTHEQLALDPVPALTVAETQALQTMTEALPDDAELHALSHASMRRLRIAGDADRLESQVTALRVYAETVTRTGGKAALGPDSVDYLDDVLTWGAPRTRWVGDVRAFAATADTIRLLGGFDLADLPAPHWSALKAPDAIRLALALDPQRISADDVDRTASAAIPEYGISPAGLARMSLAARAGRAGRLTCSPAFASAVTPMLRSLLQKKLLTDPRVNSSILDDAAGLLSFTRSSCTSLQGISTTLERQLHGTLDHRAADDRPEAHLVPELADIVLATCRIQAQPRVDRAVVEASVKNVAQARGGAGTRPDEVDPYVTKDAAALTSWLSDGCSALSTA